MADLVVPDYQVALLREKAIIGGKLSEKEEELVSNFRPTRICEYLTYLKQVYPKKFEEIVNEVKVTPIKNYRQSYNLGQILIKTWEAGKISKLTKSEELNSFETNYRVHVYSNRLLSLSYLFSFAALNIVHSVPKFTSWPIFLGQNLALYMALSGVSQAVTKLTWLNAVPSVYRASIKHKNELEALHSSNEVLYRYPLVLEEFPPNEFETRNFRFLGDSKLYEEAHRDDFNGVGRNLSKLVLFKAERWRIDQ